MIAAKRRPAPAALACAALAIAFLLAACGGSDDTLLATFERHWGDGRVETMQVYADGRVLMNHFGTIDRATLDATDRERLAAALVDVRPADDPDALPRLVLTQPGGAPIVVDAASGGAGSLLLALLETHRLP